MKPAYHKAEWSYPTSPNATRFRFPKGCWTVERVDWKGGSFLPPVALKGFARKTDAEAYLKTLSR